MERETTWDTSLLCVAEVWTPAQDRTALRLTAGSYGPFTEFEAASRGLTCRSGEGLPGRVWATRSAAVLRRFASDGHPARAARAEAQFAAALGIPIIDGEVVRAVLVLIFGAPGREAGALEIWGPHSNGEALQLLSGYYGTHDDFRRLSALLTFPQGVGLPGATWASGAPRIVEDLGTSETFVRAVAARSLGLKSGLAMPLFHGDRLSSVLVFISALGRPLARAFEVWSPAPSGKYLRRTAAAYHDLEAFDAASQEQTFRPQEGLPGRVWSSGMPVVLDQLTKDEFVRAGAAANAGLRMGVGIPVLRGGGVQSVIVLLS